MPPLNAKKLFRRPSDYQRSWLHHLNDDTSWLLQIPQLPGSSRPFFNILIDPWFDAPQVQWTTLFHWQAHLIPPAVRSIAELEDFLQDVEARYSQLRSPATPQSACSDEPSLIDALCISLDLVDHCNKETLLEVHPSVPVYGLKRSANLIKCFKHFDQVHMIQFWNCGSNWQASSVPLGTSGISIAGLKQPDEKNRYQLHYGFMVTFHAGGNPRRDSGVDNNPANGTLTSVHNTEQPSVEAIVYTPHGIAAPYLAHLPTAKPSIRYSTLIQGLDLVKFGLPFGGWNFDSNLGAHDALKVQRMLDAKYWFGTHDEIKEYGGFTSWFELREVLSFEQAIEHSLEKDEAGRAAIGTDWKELGSGESKMLAP